MIISDALDMAAIRSTTGSGRGAVLALEAGVDLLCIGNPSNLGPKQGATTDEDDYLEVFEAVCAAVADGELDRAIVERAAARVAWLARSVSPSTGSGTGDPDPEPVEGRFSDAIRRVVRVRGDVAIDASAITLVDLRDRPTFAVASAHDPFAESLAERFDVTRLAAGPSLRTPDPRAEAPASDELTLLLETIPADDGVVLLADRLGDDTPQRLAVDRVALVRPDAVVVSVGLPLSEDAVLPLPVIDTLAASRASADRVTELLSAAPTAAQTHHLHDQHHRNGS